MGHLAFAAAIEAMISALFIRWGKCGNTNTSSLSETIAPSLPTSARPAPSVRELKNWRLHDRPACRSESV